AASGRAWRAIGDRSSIDVVVAGVSRLGDSSLVRGSGRAVHDDGFPVGRSGWNDQRIPEAMTA
ncbi:hypothetical protein, partial [Lentzea sp.]|uniref:hypothetical protein n=1 Tax=Lentzea sp. TaxID=56099 RepID=UPI002ED6831E